MMRRRTGAALLAVLAVLLTATVPGAAQAQGSPTARIPLDGIDTTLLPTLADPDRVVTVMVEVEGLAVAAAQANAQAQGQPLDDEARAALRETLQMRQDVVAAEIAALGGRVVSQLQDAYNGIRVVTTAGTLASIAELPQVRGVHDLALQYPTNVRAVPSLDVPQIWEGLGFTGQGISVGIIDSGIDYTHANFGGPGDAAAFGGNDPEVVEDGSFPTGKVVGGYDFAGNDYSPAGAGVGGRIPNPDPDPLDCVGHGTHVAGTAGGLGVLADGSTYTGPYAPGAYDGVDFAIGPGVAPEVDLYALKVFGCTGGTDLTIDAIDWAVAHDLDVINLSLGAPFGRADEPVAVAANNAAAAGVVVIVSAGNSGPGAFLTGSPASASRAISVAAVDLLPTLRAATLSSDDTQLQLQVSNNVVITDPIEATLRVLADDPETAASDESLGCNPSDYEDVEGDDIVVAFRGVCPRIQRAVLAEEAGAAAVILADRDSAPPVEGSIPGVEIPFLGAGPEQVDALVALDGDSVTLADGGEVANPRFRTTASFTSAGPRLGDNGAKPDVAAPGVAIVSAGSGTGDEPATQSGTSMAAPYVSGVAALVRQARPEASVEHVVGAIVNTANPAQIVDHATLRTGAGLVQPPAAVRTPVVAIGDPGAATLSFGLLQSFGPVEETRTVTLHNHSATAIDYRTAVEVVGGAAAVEVSPAQVSVPAGGTVQASVRLRAVAPELQLPVEPMTGNVVFAPVGPANPTLRVPYVAVPRPVSAIRVTPATTPVPPDAPAVTLHAANGSPVTGPAHVFAWGLSDPADVVADPTAYLPVSDARAVGVQLLPGAAAGEPSAAFAFNTHARFSTPATNRWEVLLDVDRDGSHDFAVIGVDAGLITGEGPSGVMASVTVALPAGQLVAAYEAVATANTGALVLPFALADVGVTVDNPAFTYVAAVADLQGTALDRVGDEAAFNAFAPPVETGQSVEVPGNGAVDVPAAVNRGQLADTPVLGWLVLTPGDPAGRAQADLVPLHGG